MKINSHNEWDTLKEIIVGTTDRMTVGLEFTGPHLPSMALIEKAAQIAEKCVPEWYVEEVEDDLAGLCKILTQFGAKIFRPSARESGRFFGTPEWFARGKDLVNVRDIHLVIGDTVIAGPSPARCRFFEPNAFYDIWNQYLEQGSKWIAAPRPRLTGQYLVPDHENGEKLVAEEDAMHRNLSGGRTEQFHKLVEEEVLFDAACAIRMGRDLVYLVSNTGNHKGAQWLQTILGNDYRIHITTAYRSSHIDSTILPLRAGLVLLNKARVNEENCPRIFSKWDKLYFADAATIPEKEVEFQKTVRDKAYHELAEIGVNSDLNHMSSPWVGLNVLSLDPETVLVHDIQKNLIKALEGRNLTVIPVRMRHSYTMLGGLHCVTLDTVRAGKLESYFD